MPLSTEQEYEIEMLRSANAQTRRAVAPALEEILYQPLTVLDHGFVRVIDYMGDDSAIVQAARVSYGQGTKQVSSDRGLINYLMRNRHTSPFEMCELKLHVKLPIFVARQWIRHRTANVNEYSARYSIMDREFYVPDRQYLLTQRKERDASSKDDGPSKGHHGDLFGIEPSAVAVQSIENKQGRGDILPDDHAFDAADAIKRECERAHTFYNKLLNERPDGSVVDAERPGLARELARAVLPLNTYTQWYWKIDLHNLLHFAALRADPHAQYEIRAYAEVILDIVRRWVPLTHAAFVDYRLEGAALSAKALAVLRRRLRGETVEQADSGMTPREWRELEALLAQD